MFCFGYDFETVIDLLLKRYHSLNYILSLNYEEAISLVEFAFKQQEDELLFQRWANGPHYQMSFAEFKEMLKPTPKVKEENVEDTLEKVRVITTLMKGVN